MTGITPFLWFDAQAEEAANFYVSIFEDSAITSVSRYGEEGKEIHGRPPGSAMVVIFRLRGQPWMALNGGPAFTFTEAISFMVHCKTQDEVDHFWEQLGEEAARPASAAGSRTDTASPGRSCRMPSARCCRTRTAPPPAAS